MKTRTFTAAAALLALFLSAHTLLAQDRPAAPRPGEIRRPNIPGRPGGVAQPARPANAGQPGGGRPSGPRAATQPDGKGGAPVIPYDTSDNALNFQDASSDLVIMEYALRTGRTYIPSPATPKVTITLRTTPDSPLTDEEYLRAIREVLSLNGIVLIEEGEKFLRVVPAAEAGTSGMRPQYAGPDGYPETPEDGTVVQRMIELKHLGTEEAMPVVNSLMRPGAKVLTIEHTNSILITDNAENVNRIVEVLERMDTPVVAREEPFFRQIRYAKAEDVKARIEDLIAKMQEDSGSGNKNNKSGTVAQPRDAGSPGMERRQLPPGVTIRGGRRDREDERATPASEIASSIIDEARRGVLRGKVAIVPDPRTNRLLIITRPENMDFIDKIIEEIDIPTAPEFLVEVIRLEHAVAADVASLLNDLISKKKSSDDDAAPMRDTDKSDSGSDAAASRRAPAAAPAGGSSAQTRIARLDAENISILSDERSNSLLVMASVSDMAILRSIIDAIDIQLSQVVIETAIVSISFKDSFETGIDWAQRVMLQGAGENGPKYAGASRGGGGSGTPVPALGLNSSDAIRAAGGSAGGVTGWFSIFDWNMDLIVQAVKNDSKARLMSRPRITTMDNKEAVLEATDRIYWKGNTTYYSNSDYTSENIQNEDIGIKLTVTPRINKTGFITLTVEQEIQTNEGYTEINGSQYPQLTTRKMGADVQVLSGETVVLGGLAQNSVTKSTTKVPLLGDIPLLGWLFRHETDEKVRNEIIVFLTPRVIDTPAQMEDDARNAKAALGTDGLFDPTISASRIADPLSEKAARRILRNGADTVAPQRYPSTGALTGLNDPDALPDAPETAAIREELRKAEEESRLPYLHYSDLEAATRHPAEEPAEEHAEPAETAEPASAGGASSPSEPPPAPVEEHAEPAENAEPASAGGASAPSEPPPAPVEEHAEPAENAEPASAGGASSPSEPPPTPAEPPAETEPGERVPEPPAAEVVLSPAPETTDDLVADPSSESSN